MSTEVSELFFEALERAPRERMAFLRAATCSEAVREQVKRLVQAHEQAGDFLEDSLPDLCRRSEDRAGEVVAGYRLEAQLARGGMGEVYRARDEQGVQVAIKFLKKGLEEQEPWTRYFAREQQILAQLDHPYIVPMRGQGFDGDNTPYLVMEHVQGVAVTHYCREKQLSRAARLQLFQKICAAVAYCHGQGIVHCDIKPENILVNEEGTPQLLDFGVARDCVSTRDTGIQPMTLPYAAPEQVRGEALDLRADIYALGVLLFQMLTNRMPLRRRSPHTMRSRIQAGRTLIPQGALIPLGGRLAQIIGRCIAVCPKARYSSVQALLADLLGHGQALAA